MQHFALFDRESLRCNRHLVLLAVKDCMKVVATMTGCSFIHSNVRIIRSLKSTVLRLPRNLVPNDFVNLIIKNNKKKEYQIHFSEDAKNIDVIIDGEPIVPKGQTILLYFFRELQQYYEEKIKEERRNLAIERLLWTGKDTAPLQQAH